MPLCKLFSCVCVCVCARARVHQGVACLGVQTSCNWQEVVRCEWPGDGPSQTHKTQLSGKVIIALHIHVLPSNSRVKFIIFKTLWIFVTIFSILMLLQPEVSKYCREIYDLTTNLVLIGSEWEIFLFAFGNFMPYFLGNSVAKFKMKFNILWSSILIIC